MTSRLPAALLLACLLGACRDRAPAARVVDPPADAGPVDRMRAPDRVIAALGLRPGERVADVGAGAGHLTFRLAAAVGPSGRVVATDIDDAALASLRAHRAANVIVRKVAPDDPGLEPGAFDLILLSAVDQYLPDRTRYLTSLRAALAPGGRLAVTNRPAFRAPLLAAAAAAGYTLAREVTDLPVDYLVILVPPRP